MNTRGRNYFIAVDRDNILETTFDELRSVEDPRITFQVEVYGEQAQDSGGPRKEWIRLCNQQTNTKYLHFYRMARHQSIILKIF